jgi:hypothetical protein
MYFLKGSTHFLQNELVFARRAVSFEGMLRQFEECLVCCTDILQHMVSFKKSEMLPIRQNQNVQKVLSGHCGSWSGTFNMSGIDTMPVTFTVCSACSACSCSCVCQPHTVNALFRILLLQCIVQNATMSVLLAFAHIICMLLSHSLFIVIGRGWHIHMCANVFSLIGKCGLWIPTLFIGLKLACKGLCARALVSVSFSLGNVLILG